MTQTYGYDQLGASVKECPQGPLGQCKTVKKPTLGSTVLIFSVNANNFDFNDPKNPHSLVPQENLLQIMYENKDFDMSEHPITNWLKINDKNNKKNVSYKDLYAKEYGPIIQVLPMTQEDIQEVEKLVK